jgi:hypothetical protein
MESFAHEREILELSEPMGFLDALLHFSFWKEIEHWPDKPALPRERAADSGLS